MSSTAFVRADAAVRAALVAISAGEAEHARWYARMMRHRAVLDAALNGTGTQHGTVELAGTARIGQGRVATQCADARRLVEVFGRALGLLESGRVFVHTVELLLSMTRQCTEQVQQEVETRVLGLVLDCTTTDVRPILERTISKVEADLDPALTQQRLDAARRQCGMWVRPVADGMVQVGAMLPAVRARRFELDFGVLVTAQRAADRTEGRVRTKAKPKPMCMPSFPVGTWRCCTPAAADARTSSAPSRLLLLTVRRLRRPPSSWTRWTSVRPTPSVFTTTSPPVRAAALGPSRPWLA